MDNWEIYYRTHKGKNGNAKTGVPPLTFVSNGQNLVDYRIYGVSGGVGDRTENLFDVANQIEYYFLNPNGSIEYSSSHATNTSDYIDVTNINILTMTGIHHTPPISKNDRRGIFFDDAMRFVTERGISWDISSPQYIYVPNNAKYFRFSYDAAFENVMLHSGANDIPYEPYGYKIPIVCGGTTTNIYLDDPLNEGESISMSDTGVSIPTINGTNILTVDTAVQPSNMYIKYGGSNVNQSLMKYLEYKYKFAKGVII